MGIGRPCANFSRVSLGLSAPAAVPVELRSSERRLYRLSREIGLGGLVLVKPAPFEPGRPVTVRFSLPGAATALELQAELVVTGDAAERGGEAGACSVHFLAANPDIRSAISTYISDRLALPPLPAPPVRS